MNSNQGGEFMMFVHNLVRSLLALAWLAAVPSVWAQTDLPDIIEKISPSVIVIFVYDEADTVVAQGSGFFVNEDGKAVTNYHVIEGAIRVEVKTSDGKVYPVSSVLAQDVDGDLALMAVNVPKGAVRAAAVSQVLPRMGERIIVIGCPLGLEQTVSDGIVSAVRRIDYFGNIIQLSAPISAGSSGGPVVDMKGKVIGVAVGSIIEGQNLNFAIPGERVVQLLSRSAGQPPTSPGFPRPPLLDVASAENFYREGLALVWAGDYEKALIKFEQAVARKPDYAAAYFNIGYCHGMLGRYVRALQALEKGIQLQPDDARAWLNKGVTLGDLGRYGEALQASEKALQLQPDLAVGWCNKGVALGKLGRYVEALQAYERAIQLKPDDAEASIGKAVTLGRLGRSTEALRVCERAIQLRPEDPVAWYNKGVTLGDLGRYGEALEAFEKSIELHPDEPDAWSNKAWALEKLGRRREAEQARQKARQLQGR
jgi:S1-C subfamily serine protease